MALSPDDLSQIIQALEPVIQQKVDAATVAGPDAGGLPPLDAPGGEPGMDAPGGAPPMGTPPTSPPGLDAPGGAPGMDAPGGAPPLGGPPKDMDEDSQLYARGLGRKFMKYKKGDNDWDDEGSASFMGSLDDDDKDHLEKYFKYMCDDEGAKKKYSERYSKSPIGGEDLTEKPGDSSPSGSMNEDEMSGGKPDKYSKGKPMSEPVQYAKIKKERDDAVQKYSKLNKEHDDLKQKYAKQEQQLGELMVKERYAKRFAKLKDLESEYAFDVEEELGLVEDLNDTQFDRHVNVIIPQRYMKVSGNMIPTDPERKLDRDQDEKPQRYAKQATDVVQKYRKSGKDVDYGRVLNHLIENNGTIDEVKLFSANGHAA